MRAALLSLAACAALASGARAQVEPAAVRVPQASAWIGQRVPVLVELRAPGSFAGTAGFELPRLPGTILLKIGNPVVSSETLDGQSWFVQSHEFALFSQRPGVLQVPAFPVRFSARAGFTGPAADVEALVPGFQVELRRPPGSERVGFLITTESLEVTETWSPEPGPVQAGAVLRREIVQRASQLSGMALAPAPSGAPEGVRVYPGDARTEDRLERGEFLGERRETLKYLLTAPGTVALPALEYVWWNPRTESLEVTTLPAVTLAVAPAPAPPAGAVAVETPRTWPWLLLAALGLGLGAWRRRSLAAGLRRLWGALNPAERVAARQLRRACRRHDPAAAAAAWSAWRSTQTPQLEQAPELRCAVLALRRRTYGLGTEAAWRGDDLARAFAAQRAASGARPGRGRAPALPALNPRS